MSDMGFRRARSFGAFLGGMWILAAGLQAQTWDYLVHPSEISGDRILVVGFLGGFEPWNDPHRSVRRLALKLNEDSRFHAETFSNHEQKLARRWLIAALDADHNGAIDPGEKIRPRVILYGQSLGGGATIALANELAALNVPVLLTVQVDSVGRNDDVVPENVMEAVNYYQRDPFTIQGEPEIRARDPDHTHILGNFESTYIGTKPQPGMSWVRRVFGGGHAQMEADPDLWRDVETRVLHAVESHSKGSAQAPGGSYDARASSTDQVHR